MAAMTRIALEDGIGDDCTDGADGAHVRHACRHLEDMHREIVFTGFKVRRIFHAG